VVTLLIWKLITTIHDKKEYAKFELAKSLWKPVSIEREEKLNRYLTWYLKSEARTNIFFLMITS
jgi:hypothetical protein